MKITADTNLLIRAAVCDHPTQTPFAVAELSRAECVAVPLAALCEFVWVLSTSYKRSATEIARSIRDLIESENVAVQRQAVEAGLAFLDSGGDFADGVMIHEGRRLGSEEFVSFDKKAVTLALARGQMARLLA